MIFICYWINIFYIIINIIKISDNYWTKLTIYFNINTIIKYRFSISILLIIQFKLTNVLIKVQNYYYY